MHNFTGSTASWKGQDHLCLILVHNLRRPRVPRFLAPGQIMVPSLKIAGNILFLKYSIWLVLGYLFISLGFDIWILQFGMIIFFWKQLFEAFQKNWNCRVDTTDSKNEPTIKKLCAAVPSTVIWYPELGDQVTHGFLIFTLAGSIASLETEKNNT